ncbi:MAG: cysteine desulfurase / selenocysteine lyase [archaeon GW2011_AR19]|nr:MAG: cysteine desulfurase / selenocysteine lyase [archaeon GW2011_AR19]
MNSFKKDFPIFKNNPKLVYLDSASTSQKPKQVIKAISDFYEKENANIHRGIYALSENATKKYILARETIAKFINAETNEIIFTKNTTESINLLSNVLKEILPKGKNEIVLTEMEHHSNLVTWQEFAKKYHFKLKFIPITKNYELDYEKAKKIINDKTAILGVAHISNVFGTINNIEFLVSLAKEKKAITIIDAAQSVQHLKINVKKIGCDFLAFSGHKMFGPLGIGVLYGKKELLEKLPPFQFGGGMINSVIYEDATFLDIPEKFEAGTQNIAGAISLAEAIKYIEKIKIEKIERYEKELLDYTLKKLKSIDGIELYLPKKQSSIISFNLFGIHQHDVAQILSDNKICIRAGHHCCMPLMKKLKTQGTCRISFSIYNTKEDVDKLIEGLKKVKEVFRE